MPGTVGSAGRETALILDAGGVLSPGVDDERMSRPKKAISIKISTTTKVMGREDDIPLAPGDVFRGWTIRPPPCGRTAIRRAAIVWTGRCAEGSSGCAAIKAANLLLASSFGNRANLTASRQSGENAERLSISVLVDRRIEEIIKLGT